MSNAPGPKPQVYAGVFLVTLATLMHEILLTRIFSVTMWYHFAFMAISVAMFGMTVGAVVVYLRPKTYTEEKATHHLAWNALAYAASLVVTFLVYIQIPFIDPLDENVKESGVKSVIYLVSSFVTISIPFVFSGITVAIALTKFPGYVGKLYAADLLGAATGCIALIFTLELTDAPTAVFVVAALATGSAFVFSLAEDKSSLKKPAAVVGVGLVLFVVVNTALANQNRGIVKVREAGMTEELQHLWVRWNSFSRVNVGGNPDVSINATGWGLSERTPARNAKIPQLHMAVDTWAATVITKFDGQNTQPLWYLKDDVTNMAHHVRKNADVVVIGVGGGRDVLSALVFDQKSVKGVEINPNMLRALNEVFGDFSGHLDQHPKVRFVVDEARSHIARSDDRYDIIQISLIDTWAATAAGAFVLSESTLYTAEAWEMFLNRLKPNGVLSVSRWYYPTNPGEAYRITALAREALERIGAKNPRDHVMMVKAPKAMGLSGAIGNGIATILVSRDPFSQEDLMSLGREAGRLGFTLTLSPRGAEDEMFDTILSGDNLEAFYDGLDIDVSPPTDDKPFFFQMLRLKDFAKSMQVHAFDPNRSNLQAIRTLGTLLLIVTVLSILCIIVPLALSRRKIPLKGSTPFLVFFFAIGLGFMFVEISQMQRLMVFLGHPTYALSVVLFTLLVGTGVGSALSERYVKDVHSRRPMLVLGVLLAVLVLFGLATPPLISAFSSATNGVRVTSSAAMLLVVGLLLGTPFPLGMRAAAGKHKEVTPWLWGLNGAAGVLCSVLAMATAITWGISVSFWIGVVCYVVALVSFFVAVRKRPEAA